jgi:hypothetical protein
MLKSVKAAANTHTASYNYSEAKERVFHRADPSPAMRATCVTFLTFLAALFCAFWGLWLSIIHRALGMEAIISEYFVSLDINRPFYRWGTEVKFHYRECQFSAVL